MGVFDLLELTLSYGQYMVLLLNHDPSPFIDWYTNPLIVLNALNLDATDAVNSLSDSFEAKDLADVVPASIPLDLRFQFLLISILAPMFLSGIAVVLLAPKPFIVWFLGLLIGTILLVSGLLHELLPEPLINPNESTSYFQTIWIIGAVMLFFPVAGAVYWLIVHGVRRLKNGDFTIMLQEPISKHMTVEEIMAEDVEAFDYVGQLLRVAYIGVGVIGGIMAISAVQFPFFPFLGNLGYFGIAFGCLLFTLAGGALILGIVACFKGGREYLWRTSMEAQNILLSLSVLVVTALYVPVGSNIIRILNCAPSGCPNNYRLPDPSASFVKFSNTQRFTYPTSSNFSVNNNAPWFCQPKDTIFTHPSYGRVGCPAFTSNVDTYRIYTDRSVQCTDVLRNYIHTAASFMLVAYIVGLAVLQYVLTDRATDAVENEYPLDARQAIGLDFEQLLEEKLTLSDNVAKTIYGPFVREYRYWRMWALLHRFFLIFSSTLFFDSSISSTTLSFTLSFGFHIIMTGTMLYMQPYAMRVENWFGIATQIMLTIVAGTGLGASANDFVLAPNEYYITVAVLIFSVPLIALVVGGVLTMRDNNEKARLRADRIQNAIEKAIDDTSAGGGDIAGVVSGGGPGADPAFAITGVSEENQEDEEVGQSLSRALTKMFFRGSHHHKHHHHHHRHGGGNKKPLKRTRSKMSTDSRTPDGGGSRALTPRDSAIFNDGDSIPDSEASNPNPLSRDLGLDDVGETFQSDSENSSNWSSSSGSGSDKGSDGDDDDATGNEGDKSGGGGGGGATTRRTATPHDGGAHHPPRRAVVHFAPTVTLTTAKSKRAATPMVSSNAFASSGSSVHVPESSDVGSHYSSGSGGDGSNLDVTHDSSTLLSAGGGGDRFAAQPSLAHFGPQKSIAAVALMSEGGRDPLEFVPELRREIWRDRGESAKRIMKYKYLQTLRHVATNIADYSMSIGNALMTNSENFSEAASGDFSSGGPMSPTTAMRRKIVKGEDDESISPHRQRIRNLWCFAINQVIDDTILASIDEFFDFAGKMVGITTNTSTTTDKPTSAMAQQSAMPSSGVVASSSSSQQKPPKRKKAAVSFTDVVVESTVPPDDDGDGGGGGSRDEEPPQPTTTFGYDRPPPPAVTNRRALASLAASASSNIRIIEKPKGEAPPTAPTTFSLEQQQQQPSSSGKKKHSQQQAAFSSSLPSPSSPSSSSSSPVRTTTISSPGDVEGVPAIELTSASPQTATTTTTTMSSTSTTAQQQQQSNNSKKDTPHSFWVKARKRQQDAMSSLNEESSMGDALRQNITMALDNTNVQDDDEIAFRPLANHPSVVIRHKLTHREEEEEEEEDAAVSAAGANNDGGSSPAQGDSATAAGAEDGAGGTSVVGAGAGAGGDGGGPGSPKGGAGGSSPKKKAGLTRTKTSLQRAAIKRQTLGWRKALVGMIAHQHEHEADQMELPPSLRGSAAAKLLELQKALSQPILSAADEKRVKKHVREIYESHLKGVQDRQEATDYRVNRDTNMTLLVFFTMIGLVSFLCLGICAVGITIMQRDEREAFLPPGGLDISAAEFQYKHVSSETVNSRYMVLANYPSWDDFVGNCCCTSFDFSERNVSDTIIAVEKWLCPNGLVKERLRKTQTVDAIPTVRPMCGKDFLNGCTLTVATTAPYEVSLTGCVGVPLADQDLW